MVHVPHGSKEKVVVHVREHAIHIVPHLRDTTIGLGLIAIELLPAQTFFKGKLALSKQHFAHKGAHSSLSPVRDHGL